MKFTYILFVNCLFVDLCIHCVKMKTFLCEESTLRQNKRKSPQKVVAVAYMKWLFIRSSNYGVTVKKVLHKKKDMIS